MLVQRKVYDTYYSDTKKRIYWFVSSSSISLKTLTERIHRQVRIQFPLLTVDFGLCEPPYTFLNEIEIINKRAKMSV